jgi:hypothetical protein
MYNSLISVSISTERRSRVWNVHCDTNIIIEERRCIGTPGRGNMYLLGAEIQAKMCFVRRGMCPYFWVEHVKNLKHMYQARFMVSAE